MSSQADVGVKREEMEQPCWTFGWRNKRIAHCFLANSCMTWRRCRAFHMEKHHCRSLNTGMKWCFASSKT